MATYSIVYIRSSDHFLCTRAFTMLILTVVLRRTFIQISPFIDYVAVEPVTSQSKRFIILSQSSLLNLLSSIFSSQSPLPNLLFPIFSSQPSLPNLLFPFDSIHRPLQQQHPQPPNHNSRTDMPSVTRFTDCIVSFANGMIPVPGSELALYDHDCSICAEPFPDNTTTDDHPTHPSVSPAPTLGCTSDNRVNNQMGSRMEDE
ncbi:hypothetical protein GQ43DRAFT_61290 [Delitschia confertaspora ATCC 74209]|uniref:Uncharacterized protein n=1 Tax=Delitschia confertaspora ATCC 74209 TaxID=1513339 RepID=A0A9P4MPK4_9PLEO|nr:hypothetical protein GQ43DRAFT_61290 [Delitschia confertaspora ATCC 74209]